MRSYELRCQFAEPGDECWFTQQGVAFAIPRNRIVEVPDLALRAGCCFPTALFRKIALAQTSSVVQHTQWTLSAAPNAETQSSWVGAESATQSGSYG